MCTVWLPTGLSSSKTRLKLEGYGIKVGVWEQGRAEKTCHKAHSRTYWVAMCADDALHAQELTLAFWQIFPTPLQEYRGWGKGCQKAQCQSPQHEDHHLHT